MLIGNLQMSSNNVTVNVSCAALNVPILTNRIIPHKIHEGIMPWSRLREQGSL